ncbi:hypothetical protein E1180_18525 [Roseibium denhamense]|uniref:BBC1/AIM3 cysteine proteinase-fold domain-containing protein n=1 Tax=Roseibium denhamense TaxID=76305 RepID=A0ABY1PDW8_9HYPH|nr:hypothetical protein [Roseibium denhamense]MTI07499.1 hypothetical protein [Roseibium denhamense]SMP30036.1 hypothetical protein SAMN06265374_3195 [Roseibium denhamense]
MPNDVTAQESQRLIAFAEQRLNQVEGNGECWTLVNNGFQHLNFHKPGATYIWGREVRLSDARPGDVFQFRNFRSRVEREDGSWEVKTRGAPRHTAILVRVDLFGNATFLEANVNGSHNVQRNSFYIRTADIYDDEPFTVRISGSYTIYRPQK